MSSAFGVNRDLDVLTELCRELAKRGLKVGMSDARPAVSARGELTSRKLWISVSSSGDAFMWRRDDDVRHTTDDPAGAASQIADYLVLRDADHDAP